MQIAIRNHGWKMLLALLVVSSLIVFASTAAFAGEPEPMGACCISSDNSCEVVTEAECKKVGEYQGADSTCDMCKVPPPKVGELCHNIGGPDNDGPAIQVDDPEAVTVGANCDGTLDCVAYLTAGLPDTQGVLNQFTAALALCLEGPPLTEKGYAMCEEGYLGIVVPHSDNADNPHLRHGDGPALAVFDRVHLTQPHGSANVDCVGFRVFPQPEEPGN